jgi:A/G-specific adenine glycosylase
MREFIWRYRISPYKILIAEFMLQRTKAEQVEPVYEKFLKQFPAVHSLSKARLSSVSKYTKNLGIHWRAKHFIDAAKYIMKIYNGKFPETREELLKIPGVGDYVAGAIQAVCFNNAEYVIDSNIARFINRYYGLDLSGEIRRKKIIIDYAKKIFNVKNQKKYLFYILDFTALICKPMKPLCLECPYYKKCKYLLKTHQSTR